MLSKKIRNALEKARGAFSDVIAAGIATWTFVLIYTSAMITWVVLHKTGILRIDSDDFIRYNLFLSWAAGIQAPIILMASNRQTEKDRQKIIEGVELDKKMLVAASQQEQQASINIGKMTRKLNDIGNKIDKLEEVIGLMEEEEEEIKEKANGKERMS